MTELLEQLNVVGHSVIRTDGAVKVTGQAQFAGDLQLPGMLHCRLVVSQYAHALIRSINIEDAKKIPGVVKIVLAKDLPLKKEASESRRRNFLADKEIVFYGQPIVAVLGETEAAALDGMMAVEVDYEPLPAVTNIEMATKAGAPPVRQKATEGHGADSEAQMHATGSVAGADNAKVELPPNVNNRMHIKRGDPDAGFKEADVIVENTYHLPMVHQGYLEPQVCVAAPNLVGGMTIYTSTQAAFYGRQEVAAALGIPQNKVKVVTMEVGGGFGGKFVLLEPFTAALAKFAKRPVKLAYSRSDDLVAANPAPDAIIEVKLGAKKDGTLTAIQAKAWVDSGIYPGAPLFIFPVVMGGYYRIPNFEVEAFEVLTNRPGIGAYRAPGAPQATFAMESGIDAIAKALNLDPLELRLKNVVVEGDTIATGRPLPRIGAKECLERLYNHPIWKNRANLGANEGVGVALGGWPGGLEPASSTCRLDHDGNFTVTTGVADLTGVSTSLQLIAAEVLGSKADTVTVNRVDTDNAPYVGASGGSKTLYTLGAAVKKAAEDAKEQILNIAATMLEASPQDLELQDGKVMVKGLSSRSVSLREIATKSMNFGGRFEPVYGRGSSAITSNAPGFAAHLAHVKVDPETGEVTVLNYVAVQDVGRAINPAEVTGQIHGGVAQGLGWALYEQMVYDENGTLISGTLMDYTLQIASVVPNMEVQLVEVPSPDGPFGAKGVGEPPIVPGCATIANAIFDATGVRVKEIPAVPERVLKAIQQGVKDSVSLNN
jgi:CO/xanthine dehydrogenase Mo-binding subunit